MSKKYLVPLILVGLGLTFCETGIEIDLSCWSKHTTQIFKVKGQIFETVFGQKPWGIINLTWGWTFQKPDGDSIIIERSVDDKSAYEYIGSTQIDTVMTYTDQDTIIVNNRTYWYQLSYAKDTEVNSIKEIYVLTPSYIGINHPSTDSVSIQTDTLLIRWNDAGFGDYNIDIYKANPTQLESLVNLTNPIFSATVSDTVLTIAGADTLFDTLAFYTIKVTGSEIVEFITDTSIGFRAFFRLP
ncbi:MAG TPA: hypothetical protein EYP58_05470 [bacterium (Candidatus Stahlbacteria)]|nr:hypothetical protein [Candidatus Stahlbacteria bacterium]